VSALAVSFHPRALNPDARDAARLACRCAIPRFVSIRKSSSFKYTTPGPAITVFKQHLRYGFSDVAIGGNSTLQIILSRQNRFHTKTVLSRPNWPTT
jgi:hypothetical protein